MSVEQSGAGSSIWNRQRLFVSHSVFSPSPGQGLAEGSSLTSWLHGARSPSCLLWPAPVARTAERDPLSAGDALQQQNRPEQSYGEPLGAPVLHPYLAISFSLMQYFVA